MSVTDDTATTTPTATPAAVDVTTVAPLTHVEATAMGEEEYRRNVELLASLGPDDWSRPTDCEGWDVRAMAGHLLGAMRSAASMREMISQQRAVRRRDEAAVDAMTAIQIERTADLTTDELVAEMRALVGPAATGRRKTPALMRRFPKIRVEIPGMIDERWTLGYLVGPILTRDAWMHRIDFCRAVGRTPDVDSDHDRRFVADVAAEWCRRHGRPVELVLTGPAGGTFVAGEGGPRIELDAVEFCRTMSGRAEPTHELLRTYVPF